MDKKAKILAAFVLALSCLPFTGCKEEGDNNPIMPYLMELEGASLLNMALFVGGVVAH